MANQGGLGSSSGWAHQDVLTFYTDGVHLHRLIGRPCGGMARTQVKAALVQRALHFPGSGAQIPLVHPGIGVAAHIADGVVLPLHPSQQDLGVPYRHRHHAPFSQVTGLRHFNEHAQP